MDAERRDADPDARRAFIREHHPDRGGDPVVFIAGLTAFDQPPPTCRAGDRVRVIKRRTWPARLLHYATKRLGVTPRTPRVR